MRVDSATGEVGAVVLLELAQVLVEVIHFRLLEIFVPLLLEVTADLAFRSMLVLLLLGHG